MLSDIEIANAAELRPILQVAQEELGIDAAHLGGLLGDDRPRLADLRGEPGPLRARRDPDERGGQGPRLLTKGPPPQPLPQGERG